jgi:hypothetical protein
LDTTTFVGEAIIYLLTTFLSLIIRFSSGCQQKVFFLTVLKDYFTYEDGLNVEDFFSSYGKRLDDKNTIPNDRFAQYGVTMDTIEGMAKIDSVFRNYILPEAREIIEGKRIGFSDNTRGLLLSRGFSTALKY